MAEGLNLFQLPSIDSSTESRHDTDYYPSNSSPGNSKETIVIDVVNKSDVDFIDLGSTEVLVELRVKNKVNNVNLASTMHAEKWGICNGFGHALFKQITLQEGDIEMNSSTGTYPYQVDFETLLTNDERDLEGRLRIEGYIPDTVNTASLTKLYANDNTNAGLQVRSAMFDNGALVQAIIKPHLGPLAQRRLMLPKTRMQFKFIPNSDDFIFTHAADAAVTTYGMYIESIKLRIRTVKLHMNFASAIYRTLTKKRALFPQPVPTMTTAMIDNGILNFEKDNIFNGKIPKMLMFSIVENAAFNGSFIKNPFHYRNLNITECTIMIDGVPITQPIKTNFAGNYMEGYNQVLKATGDRSTLLNMLTWKDQPVWVFDLSPKGRNTLNEFLPMRSGNLRIELKFGTAIAGGPYTLIMYGLSDSYSEIDSFNNVIKNW